MNYKSKTKKTDLNVYFNIFYCFDVTFEDNTSHSLTSHSYYALRQRLHEYFPSSPINIEQDETPIYAIDYRKTTKEALDFAIKHNNGQFPYIWNSFDPYKHKMFPHFKCH
jgi:hypothetical protein